MEKRPPGADILVIPDLKLDRLKKPRACWKLKEIEDDH
jgi:hypothetical protein